MRKCLLYRGVRFTEESAKRDSTVIQNHNPKKHSLFQGHTGLQHFAHSSYDTFHRTSAQMTALTPLLKLQYTYICKKCSLFFQIVVKPMSTRALIQLHCCAVSISLSICLFVRPSVCPTVRLSVCLPVCLSVCPSVHPSVRSSIHLAARRSVCPSVYPPLSIYLFATMYEMSFLHKCAHIGAFPEL